MKLMWIAALVLLIVSLASLVSRQQSDRLIEESWAGSTNVLPDSKLNELQRAIPAYASRVFLLLPELLRQRFAAKTWKPIELIAFRLLVLWHLTPALLIPVLVGFLEGSWVRANQKTLIKMHSPMRFSLSLTVLGLTPILALLWVTAPVAVSAKLLVFAIGTIALFGTRNLVVHSPTQF
jgi:hypothetical protein